MVVTTWALLYNYKVLKQALLDGAQDALAEYGLAPKREKSTLRKALPWLAGAGAGLAGYKLLRTPRFSANPALREIQELAARKGFHRLVDVTPGATSHILQPMATAEGKMTPWNKLKLFLNEGTTESIPFVRGDTPKLVGHRGPKRVEGVTHGRHDIHGLPDVVRGGVDIEGPQSTMSAMNRLSKGGKRLEADILQKHAPGAMPETHTDLRHLFEGLPQDRYQAAAELQSRVLGNYGDNYMLKPNQGLASGGRFPRMDQDWASHLRAYDEHLANPETRAAFKAMKREGGNEFSQYLINNGLYEGQVLHDALRNPRSLIAQRRIDNPLGEFRVHTIAGSAPSHLVVPRGAKGAKGKLKAIPDFLGGHDDMRRFVEETVAKLPEKYQRGNYAFDVMPHKNPDGTIGYKLLEMNPTEQATEQMAGGGSGFLTPDVPMTGHLHYRAATGRHTPLVAGLGGLGAAGAAGFGVKNVLDENDDAAR